MNIFKAFLITAILIGFDYGFNYGLSYIIKTFFESEDSLEKLELFSKTIGIIGILFTIIFYIIIINLFGITPKLKLKKLNLNYINLELLVYLIALAIGLELMEKPLFDFRLILDKINGITINPYTTYERDNSTLIYMGISALFVAPIFEELIFRRHIFKNLYSQYTLSSSILISSLCFSLIHLPSYRNLLPTFIFGVFCCLIYLKTKRIIYPIMLHFFGNLIWFLLVLFGKKYYTWIYSHEFGFIYWAVVIFGILLVILSFRKITTANKELN